MWKTTALWIGSWWAPMRGILPWISAPTVSPSAKSKMTNPLDRGGFLLRKRLWLTKKEKESMMEKKFSGKNSKIL
jgi:hypothetical protein